MRNIWIKVFKIGPIKICGRQLLKNLNWMACLRRPYSKFIKGCLPQILLGPFLKTLTQMWFWAHNISVLLLDRLTISRTSFQVLIILLLIKMNICGACIVQQGSNMFLRGLQKLNFPVNDLYCFCMIMSFA